MDPTGHEAEASPRRASPWWSPLAWLMAAVLSWVMVPALPPAATAQQAPPTLDRGVRLERRVALVIGNQAYRHVPPLHNAVADARAMAEQLRQRGFEVFAGYDLDRSGMNRLVNQFEAALAIRTSAVFYFAGHGVQVGGANLLVPVDLRAENERDLVDDSLALGGLMERMAAANGRAGGGFNLLIVDACRDNPFRTTAGRSLGVSRGLTPAGVSGAMVLYAAGSNQRALDRLGEGDTDPNGLFTRSLLRALQVPGLSVREVIRRVRADVAEAARAAGHDQVPALYDEAVGDFVFTPQADPASAAVAATVRPTSPGVTPAPPAFEAPPRPDFLVRLRELLKPEIDQRLLTVFGDGRSVTVRLNARGMFPSGSATVEQRFVPILQRVGQGLSTEPGRVMVIGHSDNQPVRTLRFPSSFHLSAARAEAASAIIATATGDASRFTTEGRGDAVPIADNRTPEGREENRRIEVVLLRGTN